MEDPIRDAIHAWIREDAPISVKMALAPIHVFELEKRLRAVADGARVGAGWQPIETAKPFVRVLLWAEGWLHPVVGYLTSSNQWREHGSRNVCVPTRWMPLHEPPSAVGACVGAGADLSSEPA